MVRTKALGASKKATHASRVRSILRRKKLAVTATSATLPNGGVLVSPQRLAASNSWESGFQHAFGCCPGAVS